MNIHPVAHYAAKLLDRSSTLSIKFPCNTGSTCVCVCACVSTWCTADSKIRVQILALYPLSAATSDILRDDRRQVQLIKLSSETPTKLDYPASASFPLSLCLKRQMSKIFGHHFEIQRNELENTAEKFAAFWKTWYVRVFQGAGKCG